MRPVIPKVRVGDILLGTKNLRNWLQTASLLGYITQLADPHDQNPKGGSLFIPTKKDRFVVAANSWETFAVWGMDREVMVMFCNPTAPAARNSIGLPAEVRVGIRGTARRDAAFGLVEDPVMSPALFAQWFIRTRGKNPDLLNAWPDHAYYLWASLQMNGISSSRDSLSYIALPGVDAPFANGRHYEIDRGELRRLVRQIIRSGLPRKKERRRSPSRGRAYGPRLQDIPVWREQIRAVAANPRVMKKLKDKTTLEVPKAILEMVAHP